MNASASAAAGPPVFAVICLNGDPLTRAGGEGPVAIREDLGRAGCLRDQERAGRIAPDAGRMLAELTSQYQFFHWHLEYPGILPPPRGASGRAEAA